jgi:multisubunit Na+/H+ antiporter MnhG subunit
MWWENDTSGSVLAIHSAAALVAILLTNPVGAHAIARAAHRSGVKPVLAVVDALDQKTVRKREKKTTERKKKREETGGD